MIVTSAVRGTYTKNQHLSGSHEPHNRPTLKGSVERRGPYEPPDLRGDGNFAHGLSCLESSGLS